MARIREKIRMKEMNGERISLGSLADATILFNLVD